LAVELIGLWVWRTGFGLALMVQTINQYWDMDKDFWDYDKDFHLD